MHTWPKVIRAIVALSLLVGAPHVRAQLPAGAPAPGTQVVDTAADATIKLRGFYERRAGNRGRYFLSADIDASTGKRLSEVIRDVPGVRLLPAPSGTATAVRFRGCQPLVWVDALRNVGEELDAVVAIGDVAAMEVYVSPATVPAQFRDMRQPCGAVLVWTR